MGHKNLSFRKLHNLFGHFIKLGRILHHLVGYASQVGYKIGDRPLRIYQRGVFVYYLVAVVDKNGDFGDLILKGLPPGSFDVDYSVQAGSLLKLQTHRLKLSC